MMEDSRCLSPSAANVRLSLRRPGRWCISWFYSVFVTARAMISGVLPAALSLGQMARFNSDSDPACTGRPD